MSTARRLHHSYADYLRALERSAVKLEYCDGEMYAMAGGTPAHADLAASMTRLLGNALLGRCRVSSSDLKIRIEATDLSTFTDVSVVCGPREVAAIDQNALTNPALLVETGHFELRAVENRPPEPQLEPAPVQTGQTASHFELRPVENRPPSQGPEPTPVPTHCALTHLE